MPIGALWQALFEDPLINSLIALSRLSFGSYGIAILLFTVITKVVTFPLTLKTLRSARKMQELSPALQDINKKYTDPKRRSEETMRLYREAGVNPIGCLGPMVVQMPIFIALYATIRVTLASTPDSMLVLSSRLYDIPFVRHALPLSTDFFGMDLGENGSTPLGVIVFASMWLQQRISTNRAAAAANPQQAQMNSMMQWMIPLMFGYIFVLQVPAALGVYWGVSTIIGIILQWVFVGSGDFTWRSLLPSNFGFLPPARAAAGANRSPGAATAGAANDSGDDNAHASGGSERKDGGGGSGSSTRATGPHPRSGRRRRNPRR